MMAGILSGFGDIDLISCTDDDEEPDTVPLPGTAHLVVEDKCEALFITAEWTVVATVGAHELGRSTTIKKSHTQPYIKRWARQLIRQNKVRLRRLGVDVDATYLQWGGLLDDLT
jgi:hypothetical protein